MISCQELWNLHVLMVILLLLKQIKSYSTPLSHQIMGLNSGHLHVLRISCQVCRANNAFDLTHLENVMNLMGKTFAHLFLSSHLNVFADVHSRTLFSMVIRMQTSYGLDL